ncbi:MAG: hypothetical protein RMJ17_00565 [Candidatus Aenigmarchaeota archaeon]|nr:hypothetical protein [Candidatus Aenigmarchaeota archaeon]MDW8149080.1 hypothetical protein [Candidatus Aenigmarchaeota archaeon]
MSYRGFYRTYFDFYSSFIDSFVHNKIFSFLKELNFSLDDLEVVFNALEGFDFVSVFDRTKQELYLTTALEEAVKSKLPVEEQNRVISFYHFITERTHDEIMKFLLANMGWGDSPTYYVSKIVSAVEDVDRLPSENEFLDDSIADLGEELKVSSFLKEDPLLLILLFETETVENIRKTLFCWFVAIKKRLEQKNKKYWSKVLRNIQDWFNFLSQHMDWGTLQYLEYIIKSNEKEELFYRKKVINKFVSVTFIELFVTWVNFLKSYNFSSENIIDWQDSWHIIGYWKKKRFNNSLMLIHFTLANTLQTLEEYLQSPSFYNEIEINRYFLQSFVHIELLVYIVNHFFQFSSYLLSIPQIKDKVMRYGEQNTMFERFLSFPNQFLLYFASNYAASHSENFFSLPLYFLPPNMNEPIMNIKRNLKKIEKFALLKPFRGDWKIVLSRKKDYNRSVKFC